MTNLPWGYLHWDGTIDSKNAIWNGNIQYPRHYVSISTFGIIFASILINKRVCYWKNLSSNLVLDRY